MRVQVNVSDELVERIDKYAKTMGVSRSALCSVWIGTHVMSLDKSMDILDEMGVKLTDVLLTEGHKQEAAVLE